MCFPESFGLCSQGLRPSISSLSKSHWGQLPAAPHSPRTMANAAIPVQPLEALSGEGREERDVLSPYSLLVRRSSDAFTTQVWPGCDFWQDLHHLRVWQQFTISGLTSILLKHTLHFDMILWQSVCISKFEIHEFQHKALTSACQISTICLSR